jgi:hypothetical protein
MNKERENQRGQKGDHMYTKVEVLDGALICVEEAVTKHTP